MIVIQYSLLVITMNHHHKPKITLKKHNHLLANHLLRHYINALQSGQYNQHLNAHDLLDILDHMGYLPLEKAEKDCELVNTIAFMLCFPKNQNSITQRNFFLFLLIINDLHQNIDKHFQNPVDSLPKDAAVLEEPLIAIRKGIFDNEGKWQVSKKEEQELKKIFNHMIFTRNTRTNIIPSKNSPQDLQAEQRRISKKSLMLAQEHYRKLGNSKKVQDRLMQEKQLYDSRLQRLLNKSIEQQQMECSFKPMTNSRNYQINKENNHSMSYQSSLLHKGREYSIKNAIQQEKKMSKDKENDLAQCSFHPNLYLSSNSLRKSQMSFNRSVVRATSKSIDRVKIGRLERQSMNIVQNRGYPKGTSWMNFLSQSRKKLQNSRHSHSKQASMIFNLDLKISGQKRNLMIREGDNIQELLQNLSLQSNLSNEGYIKLLQMVSQMMVNSGQAVIKNKRIHKLK